MHRCTILTALVLFASVSAVSAGDTPAAPSAPVKLFNGTDLTGWWGLGTEDPAK